MLSGEATRMRVDADAEIGRQIGALNEALARIEQLSSDIQSTRAVGRDSSALEDERARQIDVVNAIVPVRVAQEQGGGMLLTSQGGATLMTGNAHGLSFDATHANGIDTSNTLGGVTLFGRTSSDMAALGLGGGALDAAFKTRDATAVGFGAELDAIARDLVERFQSASNATGGVTDSFMAGYDFASSYDGAAYQSAPARGLFTDEGGARFDAASPTLPEAGLAGRITLNAALDSAAGGDPALLQTGLYVGAPEPGPGAAGFPTALYDAFTAQRTLTDGAGNPGGALGVYGSRSAVDMVSEWSGLREAAAGRAETEASFQRGVAEAMREEELAVSAVNTDEELSNLLRIEQAYAANARVLEAVEQMMNRILQI
jgi:flagellar hook-associated protein 1 FlgK